MRDGMHAQNLEAPQRKLSRCPPTPQSLRLEELKYERKPMVNWFDPGQLLRTGVKALLAGVFGAYSDKREIQAALQLSDDSGEALALKLHPYAEEEEIWIDYIADLGDGWASTYTLAWLLSRKELALAPKEQNGSGFATQRGRILIMGGDQVYPTAKRKEYQNRMIGPYLSALPWVDEEEEKAPHLFAIPGNHDWYDGLTAFNRLFCQQRWIGGWQTQQSRSYFALKLPHNWWLWGIDIQLDSDIDKPQLDYFKMIARENMQGGDHRVILCLAEPSWVYTATEGQKAYQNLEYFERETIRKFHNTLALTLTGDLHHYSRYQEKEGAAQKITAGGGGAYLFGTHRLPEELTLQEKSLNATITALDRRIEKDESEKIYTRKAAYPAVGTSRRLALGVLLFPFQNYTFALFLGFFYLMFAWMVQSASGPATPTFMEQVQAHFALTLAALLGVCKVLYGNLKYSPAGITFAILIVAGLVAFCSTPKMHVKLLWGALHGLLHLLLSIVLIWLFAYLNLSFLGMKVEDLGHSLVFGLEMLLFGGLIGGLMMAVYLLLSDILFKIHTNEVFAAQRIADYKNFLRLHLDKNGQLTVYPVGVRKTIRTRSWELNFDARFGQSWFGPKKKEEVQVHLIEAEPIHINKPSHARKM